jgi:hypothetical protein
MLAPRLHPIFVCVVLAEDLADLPGKALVGFGLGLVVLLQLWRSLPGGCFFAPRITMCRIVSLRRKGADAVGDISLLNYVQFPVQSAKFPVSIGREWLEETLNLLTNQHLPRRQRLPYPVCSGRTFPYHGGGSRG